MTRPWLRSLWIVARPTSRSERGSRSGDLYVNSMRMLSRHRLYLVFSSDYFTTPIVLPIAREGIPNPMHTQGRWPCKRNKTRNAKLRSPNALRDAIRHTPATENSTNLSVHIDVPTLVRKYHVSKSSKTGRALAGASRGA